MADNLNILVIEDSPADFLLVERHLRKNNFAARCRRVATFEDLACALTDAEWDAVLADYNVPRLRFEDGLTLIRQHRPDLPIVLISGSVGEEKAVELLKLGVWDFVLKGKLVRLVPVLERSLKDAAEYRAREIAEHGLRESEERLRLTLEAAEVVAWELNLANHEVRETGPVGALFGRAAGFQHHNLDAFAASIHPDDRARVRHDLAAAASAPADGSFVTEFRVPLPDGGLHWLMSTGSLARDRTGRPVRLLGIARNISRRKEAEDAALRANAALLHAARLSVLGEVASTIAHEVNQPIGAARNYLQAARCTIANAAVSGMLDKVDAQLTRAADTVRKVREFAAHHALEVRPEAVRALIGDACALGLLDAAEQKVLVTQAIPDGLPSILVDRVQIQQILINVIRNAVEAVAGADRKEIRIAAGADPTGTMVEITVADSGPGIPDAWRARLFTSFWTTKANGTGLGLSTSRSIAEAHGGRLWAEDQAGGGTVFRLTLPIGEARHG